QVFSMHTPLPQSPAMAQVEPVPQSPQEPPQSMSVSEPLATPSLQVAAWQMFKVHTPLPQSPAMAQVEPVPQSPQEPSQSMSVSEPLVTPSLQVGTWQKFSVQTPLPQSPATPQSEPSEQASHVEPPESASVSSPFWIWSSQVGSAVALPAVETEKDAVTGAKIGKVKVSEKSPSAVGANCTCTVHEPPLATVCPEQLSELMEKGAVRPSGTPTVPTSTV